jgi:hypothetical protein
VRHGVALHGAQRRQAAQQIVDEHLGVVGATESDAGRLRGEIDEEIAAAQQFVARGRLPQVQPAHVDVVRQRRKRRRHRVLHVVGDDEPGAAIGERRHEVRAEKPASASDHHALA